MAVRPSAAEGRPQAGSASFTGLGGFIRLALFVLVRQVKLVRMKATLSQLQGERDGAYASLGRQALEAKLAHPAIEALAKQIESSDAEAEARRKEIRAIEAEPLADDPQIRKAEMNLRKVKTGKVQEALRQLEAKTRPMLAEIGGIVLRENLAAERFQASIERVRRSDEAVKAQDRLVTEMNREFEAVSPGMQLLAYAFWAAIVVILLAALIFVTRGCSSGAQETSKPTACQALMTRSAG
jgi:hypothetical protein